MSMWVSRGTGWTREPWVRRREPGWREEMRLERQRREAAPPALPTVAETTARVRPGPVTGSRPASPDVHRRPTRTPRRAVARTRPAGAARPARRRLR